MKVQFEKEDKKYFFIVIGLLLFIVFSAFQYYRNRDLTEEMNKKLLEVENLKKNNEGLLKSIDKLTIVKDSLSKIADSIEVKEQYYKDKYYATNKKLKDILNDYDNLDDDDKWDEFSNAINN